MSDPISVKLPNLVNFLKRLRAIRRVSPGIQFGKRLWMLCLMLHVGLVAQAIGESLGIRA